MQADLSLHLDDPWVVTAWETFSYTPKWTLSSHSQRDISCTWSWPPIALMLLRSAEPSSWQLITKPDYNAPLGSLFKLPAWVTWVAGCKNVSFNLFAAEGFLWNWLNLHNLLVGLHPPIILLVWRGRRRIGLLMSWPRPGHNVLSKTCDMDGVPRCLDVMMSCLRHPDQDIRTVIFLLPLHILLIWQRQRR